MVINDVDLIKAEPIKDMLLRKVKHNGVSHGLAEAGYDIRIKQTVCFQPGWAGGCPTMLVSASEPNEHPVPLVPGNFTLASAMELFQMPNDLIGIVHDKSTWARHGLSVFNTVIEPGWHGYLTLELAYHGRNKLVIPAGSGIAQVIFSKISQERAYQGKYQHQADKPISPIMEIDANVNP